MDRSYLVSIKVRDCIDYKFILLNEDSSIKELSNCIIREGVKEVLVCDLEGRLTGIVTRDDLAKGLARGFKDGDSIKEIMTKGVVTVSPDDDLLEARGYLRSLGVGRAPVIEDGKILGILTTISICDGFSNRLDNAVDFLHSVFNKMDCGVIISDSDMKVCYFNHEIENILDRHCDELLGVHLESIFEPDIMSRSRNDEVLFETKGGMFIVNTSAFNMDRKKYIITTLKDVTRTMELVKELDTTKNKLIYLEDKLQKIRHEKVRFGDIETSSRKMEDVIDISRRVAKTSATVLIYGESGTGKEKIADAIYESSLLNDRPFIKVNCGAIPYNLCESELFGYEQGAFTGASRAGKAGLFESADGGTIFLDEIAELPLEMQTKLLRVLQEYTFYRVGGTRPVKVNVRVIAATNRDLGAMVKKGSFREDLYYRLNVITVTVPPLRERSEDIIPLTKEFIDYFSKEYNTSVKAIEPELVKRLTEYSWPGNVRELKNTIERLIILAEDGVLKAKQLPDNIAALKMQADISAECGDEREMIIKAIKKYKNKTKVARALNMPRSTLYYKLKNYNITI